MKKYIYIYIILVMSIFISSIGYTKVIGEYSYNVCLDECCREYLESDLKPGYARNTIDFNWHGNLCKKNMNCSECLDNCKQELQNNNPSEYERLKDIDVVEHTPTDDCFIDNID